MSSATAGGTQALLTCVDCGSLEVLTAGADNTHEVHPRPVVTEVSRESADVVELRRQMAVLAANVITPMTAMNALRSTSASKNSRSDGHVQRSASDSRVVLPL